MGENGAVASLDRKARREALEELRGRYFKELEHTLLAYMAIRDDEKAPAAARVNAGKRIEAMLGVPRTGAEQVPNIPATPESGPDSPAPKLDKAVEDRIKGILGK